MTTSAFVLIASVLVLSGLMAALGDYLGMKVGRSRRRLFNLRPRETARVITVVTGVLSAALTLTVLFTLSESLRKGVLYLDEILNKHRQELKELNAEKDEVEKAKEEIETEKKQVEQQLSIVKNRQREVQKLLSETNQKYNKAQAQLKAVSQQAKTLNEDVKKLVSERKDLLVQRDRLKEQITGLQEQTTELRSQVTTLEQQVQQQNLELAQRDRKIAERDGQIASQDKILAEQKNRLSELEAQQSQLQAEISQRDQKIDELDQQIAQRDRELQTREAVLKDLAAQTEFLKREVDALEQYYQYYQALRQGNVALIRGQVLASAVVRIVDPNAALSAIDRLLAQANRNAIKATKVGDNLADERVVQITEAQVNQLIDQIKDGQDYIVRILSAGNYVQGEQLVRVFADVAPNKIIFDRGEVVATVSLDTTKETQEDLQQRFDLLISAAQFRARRAGILGEIKIGDGNLTNLIRFFEDLKQSDLSIDEIKAIVDERTYTAGPLKLRLIALKNGEIVFST